MPSTASRRRRAAKPHNSTTAEQPTPDNDIHTVATTTTQRGSKLHRHTLHVAAVVVLAVVVYSNTLPNGFVFDDNVAIVGNNDVTVGLRTIRFTTNGSSSIRLRTVHVGDTQGKGETNYTAIFTHDFWGEDIHRCHQLAHSLVHAHTRTHQLNAPPPPPSTRTAPRVTSPTDPLLYSPFVGTTCWLVSKAAPPAIIL